MKTFELTHFSTADDLARTAAGNWLAEVEAANRAGTKHCVALSGGRITQKFFAATVEQAKARNTAFAPVHFFWADERCVPPSDPESNFKMADELLFKPLNISPAQIHRIHGEDPPETAANAMVQEFCRIAPDRIFDLIFLGMGEDGHVASLFPNASTNLRDAADPFIIVKNSPKPPPTRISLSYRTIFDAKNVWVLVSGAGKETAFRESLAPDGRTPLARVLQGRPTTKVFSDIK